MLVCRLVKPGYRRLVPCETSTFDAETRPRQKYAKLSYAGWRTKSGPFLSRKLYRRRE